jgi:large subunit ribosomal protein L15
MDLTQVSQGVHKRKLKKRVGRGIGSGHGKTSGHGMKGQYASAGAEMPKALFEGGQTPMYRRFPKRGFTNATWKKEYAEVNVDDLGQYPAGTAVDMALLKNASPDLTDEQVKGLTKEQKEKRDAGKPFFRRLVVGTYDGLRVLGDGELTKKLAVKAHHFSKSAKEKIEKAGGTTEVIPPPKKPVKNKMKPRPPKPATGG